MLYSIQEAAGAALFILREQEGSFMFMKQEYWSVYAKRADFGAIAENFHIDPVVARVIRNRDIIGNDAIEEYLNGGLEKLHDPFLMKDMDKAAKILKMKIASGASIRIIGDYDIDGVMSSYILRRGIEELGGDADIHIPNRVTDGYGISESMILDARDDSVNTIITCDNGIAASAQIELAKSFGMTVIVTDHHEVLSVPKCDAVIDPKRSGDAYPCKDLCGAAVAWKLVRAMGGDPDMKLLQYVAFATVGDVVNLTGENRILVREGMKQLRETDNPGLCALAAACGVDLKTLSTYHIGFVLGPCLNASGRLDTAQRSAALLAAPSEAVAARYAEELLALNNSRKSMTETGVNLALAAIEREHMENDRVLVIYLPGVHESIAGIIAGRIRETMSRPVFVLTRGQDCVKGSGRSIEAYSMFEKLTEVQDLLIRFGGHPMAAGLSIAETDIGEFRRRLNEKCGLTDEDLVPKIMIDAAMPIQYVTEELIGQLENLAPFGKGNERPVFAQKHVYCDHPRLFGAKRNVLKMRIRSLKVPGDADPARPGFQARVEGPSFDAVCFRNAQELYDRIMQNPDIAITYTPKIDEYMGRRRIQIGITHFH